jgi:hypothetical protein
VDDELEAAPPSPGEQITSLVFDGAHPWQLYAGTSAGRLLFVDARTTRQPNTGCGGLFDVLVILSSSSFIIFSLTLCLYSCS